MKTFAIFVACLAALASSVATAHDYKLGAIQIAHPWARATPKGASVGGGYMTITNTGITPDRLVGGTSSVAGHIEFHQMSMENGVMRMRPLRNGLEINPGQTVELKPSSFHVMMLDLKSPIKEGERVKGTLTFEKAGAIEVEYAVVAPGTSPGGASKGEGAMTGGDHH